jgi:peptide/nickel transport system ATP-binding protein
LPDPEIVFDKYPHEISGGQKKRVMIAMAIACKPQLLIADEPTTALDVTVQKEIIQLLKDIQQETGMSIIFISRFVARFSYRPSGCRCTRVKLWSKGSKTNFKIQHKLYSFNCFAPSLDFRLKRLPTIQDFLEDSINTEVVKEDRTRFHDKLYSQTPILEVINVEKEYFLQPVSLEKNQDLKR